MTELRAMASRSHTCLEQSWCEWVRIRNAYFTAVSCMQPHLIHCSTIRLLRDTHFMNASFSGWSEGLMSSAVFRDLAASLYWFVRPRA